MSSGLSSFSLFCLKQARKTQLSTRLKLVISLVNEMKGIHEQGVNNLITRNNKVHVDGC